MSLESRLKSASLHLLQAAAELVPLPQRLLDQRQGLLFARAAQGYQLSAAVGAALELGLYRFRASQVGRDRRAHSDDARGGGGATRCTGGRRPL
jgi:hypothetical protein